MSKNKVYVWTCKIIVAADKKLPKGFDIKPRNGAQNAIEDKDFKVLMNSSGWGGSLNESDMECLEHHHPDRFKDMDFTDAINSDEESPSKY